MYLGIDLGTSCVKVIILDNNDQLLAQASSALTISRPHDQWSEQDPNHWWQATCSAMAELKTQKPELLKAIKSIGLSGQMHGATLLDSDNQVIRPAILWNDGRSEIQCKTLEENEPNSRNITGNIAMPGFTAPKLLWVKEHEPENFNKVSKVLLPKDFLRFKMTGDFASDMSDSAGTLWLDVKNRCWSEAMLTATSLSIEHMPQLFEGTDITGKLSPNIASLWGMDSVPVVAGAGDNAAGAIGIGVIKPNQAFLSLGTSGVYFVANEQYLPNPDNAAHTFCHCLSDTWHQMSVVLSAASCLSWVTKLTGYGNESALLEQIAKCDFSQPNSVLFLPYLSGERTPHNNPNAKGVFFGLDHNTTAASLGRAVLEGVAFAFADGQQVLLDAGATIDEITVIGGGSKSRLWGDILASVLNRSLSYREGGEVGPAYGAARLARIAVEQSPLESICTSGKLEHLVLPNPEMQVYYADQYQKFKALYQATKHLF
ncbi:MULTISPECIES: xylulokinase [unclassified Shewanella]|uniref:xylulokinase n=1 Tax=unclassified Shewanella TaxID=196818 RepID=UPI000C8504E0|nr:MULTISPECIES: xylulokinase [unclassified Shewanella]MDO6618329.1 xylulokinase [Shewanella sp. 6_MG-2023]MDO6679266.1 xylulokinase [Shewanella sp. 4_MG-2023]PMG28405.1 xylulokinase [Shewanella sp. 10N.286.52.C2]PMH89341.1 xylulokinase [Shewanella sp. 10N.286.48.B5]